VVRHAIRVPKLREQPKHYAFLQLDSESVFVRAETKEILGAAILGIGGDEVVHVLLAAMYAKAPYTVISRAVFIHPTVAELVPTILQSLQPLGPPEASVSRPK